MTDRPSAATPEEVLDGWMESTPTHDGSTLYEGTYADLLDLIRRAQAAQRETDAQVVEAVKSHSTTAPPGHVLHCYYADAAAAIRAGE